MLEPFEKQWAMLLRTRKRDGSWVATPVNVAVSGEPRSYFGTPAKAAKVKRLRNFDAVEIAPCTPRGRPTCLSLAGAGTPARGRGGRGGGAACSPASTASVHRFVVPLELRLKGTHNVVYELTVS